MPDDVNSRVKRSVISIAEDHSIAIISIEEMSWYESRLVFYWLNCCSGTLYVSDIAVYSYSPRFSIYLFGGYEHALVSIQWRPPEDYIVLWHADETAFVWQVRV